MIKITIKDWVILLAVLPTLVIGSVLGAYFANTRINELDQTLHLQAKAIADPLAIASAHRMENHEYFTLKKLIQYVHVSNSDFIKTILLFDKDNRNLLNSSPKINPQDYILNNDVLPAKDIIIDDRLNYYVMYYPIELEVLKDNGLPTEKLYFGYFALEVDKSLNLFNKQIVIVIALTTIFLGVLISAFFANKLVYIISQPVKEMNDIVLQIRQGVLDSRIDKPFEGELDNLRIGINNMAQAIEDYQKDLEANIDQATLDLREALEQFEIQNVQLNLAKRKAQDANRVKSEFLANMSHELRTPLNGVIGFTRQVLKTPLSETQREYLSTIDNSANNLLAIINDILDFSKLESGHMTIEHIPFGFRGCIDETITLLAPTAHNKNLELSINIAPNLPNSLIGDSLRIKQVLLNLVGNAIKFTDQGNITIDVDYEDKGDSKIEVMFNITDTGIGISDEQKENLFEAFSQADKSITRLYGGTGLGLVICKRLAQEMDGDITYTSKVHQGTSFNFSFNVEINQLPVDNVSEPFELEHKRILYLEPNVHARDSIVTLLEHWNMKVTVASNIEQLVKSKDLHKFDFALIGQKVTTTNINDIKNLISSLSESAKRIIVAINSNSLSLQQTFVASGARNCISKPLTQSNLTEALLSKNLQLDTPKERATIESHRLPISVLIVDDNEANLKLLFTLISQKVETVVQATNGRDALNLCHEQKFDLILMDIQMPVMDGITAMKQINSNSLNIDTKIIAVTAHALAGEKEKLIRSGFNGYMAKPIDESILEHIIYEHAGVEHIASKNELVAPQKEHSFNGIFDWQLAMQRSGNNEGLAFEMLGMLIRTLPETAESLAHDIKQSDAATVASILHKLNGACCYVGVPRLEKIAFSLETQLKQGELLDALEPEFFELFDEIDTVLNSVEEFMSEVRTVSV